MSVHPESPRTLPVSSPRALEPPQFHALLYGLLLCGLGFAIYGFGVVLACVRLLLDPQHYWLTWVEPVVWLSGIPAVAGTVLIALDLFVLLPRKRSFQQEFVRWNPPSCTDLTVVLTAFNDEESIARAVADFQAHPKVRRVIVVDNNSSDGTAAAASAAGAIVVEEHQPGYGRCVWRALSEGLRQSDTVLTLLCEGDMTFRASDIDKFLAYAPHADIVNGTRIVEQLRARHTQLTTFMYFGNFFAGKLLEAKHISRGTFTDVGTTYKLCRNSALQRLLPLLNPAINLEFNAHLLDTALNHNFAIVECPVTFHNRVGASKGGNVSNGRALKVGLCMIKGIVLGWQGRG